MTRKDDDQMTANVTAAYTALGPRWDTSGASWNQPVAARLVALASLAPPMQVLDAGCGAGAATVLAAAAVTPGGHVTGIDVSGTMIDRARQRAAAEGLDNITLHRADAMAPPFGPGSFDAIVASLVVYLLPGPAAAAARWRILLVPGGVLAFSWVLAEDPAWEPVFDAVDAFVPRGKPTWAATWRRWKNTPDAEAILGRGYSMVATTAEPVTTRYTSAGHWWESSWTQAPAKAWQHIPPARRGDARAAAYAALAPLAGPGGTLTRVRTTCYTTARAVPPGRRIR